MSDARAPNGSGALAEAPLQADQRSGRRQKQLKAGIIVLNYRRSTLACTIRDVSAMGARLRLGSVVNLPENFELIFVNERKIVRVMKCWHSHPDCGIEFKGEMLPAPNLASKG